MPAARPVDLGAPQLFRSTDGAVTWQPVATFPAPLSPFGGAAGNTLSALAIDPVNPSRLYAGFVFPDYLMRSEDGGATWTRITSGLGAGEITSIVFSPTDPNTLHVSQFGSGVFRSTDRGATWTAMDAGLGDELVLKLEQDPFQRRPAVRVDGLGHLHDAVVDGRSRWLASRDRVLPRAVQPLLRLRRQRRGRRARRWRVPGLVAHRRGVPGDRSDDGRQRAGVPLLQCRLRPAVDALLHAVPAGMRRPQDPIRHGCTSASRSG